MHMRSYTHIHILILVYTMIHINTHAITIILSYSITLRYFPSTHICSHFSFLSLLPFLSFSPLLLFFLLFISFSLFSYSYSHSYCFFTTIYSFIIRDASVNTANRLQGELMEAKKHQNVVKKSISDVSTRTYTLALKYIII